MRHALALTRSMPCAGGWEAEALKRQLATAYRYGKIVRPNHQHGGARRPQAPAERRRSCFCEAAATHLG